MVTIGQIKDRTYLYRALETHFVLYLALYKLYIEKFIDESQLIEKDLKAVVVDAITETADYKSSVKEAVITNQETILEVITSLELTSLQRIFDTSISNQLPFYQNRMTMFEERTLWPYFFAFDMINYSCMTPVYLAQMYELKGKDQVT